MFLYDRGINSSFAISSSKQIASTFQRLIEWNYEEDNEVREYDDQVEVEFVTKYRSNLYGGDILDYMFGLDLSCNKLTGRIP